MGLVSLRLPTPMLAAIERIARAQRVSVSDVIRKLLQEALKRAGT
jgi:Arc/MetJ-type ribon-helix-helix transcriptional regulator